MDSQNILQDQSQESSSPIQHRHPHLFYSHVPAITQRTFHSHTHNNSSPSALLITNAQTHSSLPTFRLCPLQVSPTIMCQLNLLLKILRLLQPIYFINTSNKTSSQHLDMNATHDQINRLLAQSPENPLKGDVVLHISHKIIFSTTKPD